MAVLPWGDSGIILSLIAGFLNASVFICARKANKVCANLVSCATAGVDTFLFLVLPSTALVSREDTTSVMAEPWLLASLIAGTFAFLVLGIRLIAPPNAHAPKYRQ